MTLWPLVAALYFMVSGGPYGLEELAHKVGFGPAIAVIVATPLVWSLPTALMVGELSSSLPEEGGYYAWVRRALGPFWGFQEAWLSLAASVFDMALYPTLFALYLGRLFPALAGAHWAIGAGVIAVGAGMNLAGAKAVGEGSLVMTVLMLAPFVAMAGLAVGAPAAAPSPGVALPAGSDLAGGVLVAMWNTMGWDNASTIAGEVVRPQRTYPVGVLVAVVLVTVAYVVPLAAMRAAGVDPSGWDTGSWVDAARTFGGRPLATALVVGGMISAFGMFNALCLSYSRVPAVLAQDGYLPRALALRTPRGGAPWVSILVCAGAWLLSLGLPFERLVSLDILLYGSSLVLEFVALVVLRVREPSLPRPFRVPGGLPGAVLLGVGPVGLLGVALVKNLDEHVAGMNAIAFGALVAVAGAVVYRVLRPRAGGT